MKMMILFYMCVHKISLLNVEMIWLCSKRLKDIVLVRDSICWPHRLLNFQSVRSKTLFEK